MKRVQVKTPGGSAYVDFDEVIALGPEHRTGAGTALSVRTMYLRGGSEMTVLDESSTMKWFLDGVGS